LLIGFVSVRKITILRIIRDPAGLWSTNDINAAVYDTGFELMGDVGDVLDPIRDTIDGYSFQD